MLGVIHAASSLKRDNDEDKDIWLTLVVRRNHLMRLLIHYCGSGAQTQRFLIVSVEGLGGPPLPTSLVEPDSLG